ncbi:efflux RND transporter periplasmic adaptor subunit [Granulicatella seriolae]|uniref:Efflux RND transporter periplasmic adaptor subunit n=1 Tax=Granulicatella seriolae TaxID=2967226 RepID=A0ABT1WQL4_9LACT|nr:biotin/lipoyl-binding protein [Granulicatella seriolae]
MKTNKRKQTNKPTTKKNKWLVRGIIALFAIGAIAIAYTFLNPPKSKDTSDSFTIYTVGDQEDLILNGQLTATNETSYTFDPQKGSIETVSVVDGQEVTQGQALFRYSNETLSQELSDMSRQQTRLYDQRASAEEELTKQQNARWRYIVETREAMGNPEATVDTSSFDAGIEASKKGIADLTASIEDLEVKIVRAQEKTEEIILADNSGIVTLNQAGRTNATQPFIKVVSQDAIIKTTITEYDFLRASVGQAVTVYINAQDRDITGQITFIAKEPTQEPPTTTGMSTPNVAQYKVEVTPSEELPNGFNVQVKVPQSSLIVPESAVLSDGEEEYVFLVVDGHAKRQVISRTKQGFQKIISQGLNKGDVIVSNPSGQLTDGQAITTITEDSSQGAGN